MLEQVNALECAAHRFEIIKLERVGEHWLAQFAVDGKKYPHFYEPVSNVAGMNEQDFLRHMQAQSLTMMQLESEAA